MSSFDSVPWDLMLKAVAHHADQKWIVLYVERWLKAPMQRSDGTLLPRVKGTPQGSPISPCLANLFLHYGLDAWMERTFPTIQFERFADDAVIHCVSESQARFVRDAVARRLVKVGLELHPDKTTIVYCKDGRRRGTHEHVSFTLCGYTFRPRKAYNKRTGEVFTGFLPAVSPEKLTAMSRRVGSWRIHRRVNLTLEDLAAPINQRLRGWLAYFTEFYPTAVIPLCQRVDRHLLRWARWKYNDWHTAPRGHERGFRASEPGTLSCSCTGGTAALRPPVRRHEPYESRGSRADLWGPAGEIPAGYPANSWPPSGRTRWPLTRCDRRCVPTRPDRESPRRDREPSITARSASGRQLSLSAAERRQPRRMSGFPKERAGSLTAEPAADALAKARRDQQSVSSRRRGGEAQVSRGQIDRVSNHDAQRPSDCRPLG